MKTTFKSILYSALFGACILSASSGFAQVQENSDESAPSPKFGIKGGINLANLYQNDVGDDNMKVGALVGVYAKLPITKGLSIQPEVLYSNKGSQVTYNNFIQGSGQYRFNLNYIEVPLSLVINIVPNLNIHAGGYASYLTAANVKNVRDGSIVGVTDLNADDFNRFDYGLIGGIALDLQNFTIGARYNYGLREIGQSGNLSGDVAGNSKNSALSLYVGFGF